MHTFGFPWRIDELVEVGKQYNIPIIEDSAESIGSYYKGKHTGTFGMAGMILTDDETLAKNAKHIITTAKVPHKWEYV